MAADNALEKTNRMNLLFDFYHSLLTEKQQVILRYYFHEDYSLGEIAELLHISRQAVYEHIKRAEAVLEEYEQKLRLLDHYERREKLLARMEAVLLPANLAEKDELLQLVRKMRSLDR
jgi:hypothetical protein